MLTSISLNHKTPGTMLVTRRVPVHLCVHEMEMMLKHFHVVHFYVMYHHGKTITIYFNVSDKFLENYTVNCVTGNYIFYIVLENFHSSCTS